jgi:hypothetical protein
MRALKRVPAGTANSLAAGATAVRRTVVFLRRTGLRVCAKDTADPAIKKAKSSRKLFLIVILFILNIVSSPFDPCVKPPAFEI